MKQPRAGWLDTGGISAIGRVLLQSCVGVGRIGKTIHPINPRNTAVMAAKEPSRRSYLSLKALDPLSGQTCEVQVSFDRMQAVGRRSMAHAKECGVIMPLVLQDPAAVFEGLRSTKMTIAKRSGGAATAVYRTTHTTRMAPSDARILAKSIWYSSTARTWHTIGGGRNPTRTIRRCLRITQYVFESDYYDDHFQ
jgi:hypothetical protein